MFLQERKDLFVRVTMGPFASDGHHIPTNEFAFVVAETLAYKALDSVSGEGPWDVFPGRRDAEPGL